MYKKKQTVNYPKKAMVANPGFKQVRNLDFQISSTVLIRASIFLKIRT